ncbi:hypothetical protein [Streptomyces sp. 11x1]|uniref:hypothetical protein n=1 Tax=Streptomyces sp. 11x1 TaxID=3038642 RepID=UPI00292E34B7|nr:hypothetical protein [Streptomyces sp. 11x1]WNZ06584.1 hypothetical protein P8T65_02605 [Streptomyces sp. 11x1]
MTPTTPGRTADALDPVRAEMLRAARTDAEALSARAATEAAAVLDGAGAGAAAVLDEARRQGEADGATAARDLLLRARREARSRILSARREAYDDLRRAIADRVGELRRTDDYADLRGRLERLARALLGPDAEVTEHPEGGVVARAPGRRVDLSLTALADRALDRLGGEVRVLWEP